MTTVTEAESKGQGKAPIVRIDTRWSHLVGIAAFLVMIAPALIFVGRLSTRVETIETGQVKHEEDGGHAEMKERMTAVETKQNAHFEEIVRRLQAIEQAQRGLR